MEKSLGAMVDKIVKSLTPKIEKDIMAKTEAALKSNNHELSNKITAMTETMLHNHTKKQKEMIQTTTQELFQKHSEEEKDSILSSVEDHLRTQNLDLNIKLQALEKENLALKMNVDSTDNYTRRDNLVVSGLEIPDQPSGADLSQPMIDFFNKSLGLNVRDTDVSIAHYIPGSHKAAHEPILIRFTIRRMRDRVYAQRKSLRTHNITQPGAGRVYINEHLTRPSSLLFAETRKLLKQKSLFSTWTREGLIFARLRDNPDEKPTKIASLKDLEALTLKKLESLVTT